MRALLAFGPVLMASLGFAGCNTPPPTQTDVKGWSASSAETSVSAKATTTTASAAPSASASAAPEELKQVGASQVLVTWKGAEGAAKTVTRSKEDAKKRAEEALAKVKGGAPFEDVAKEYSDDPSAKKTLGAMGNFERNVMPAAFSDAAFALEVGGISAIVETPRGFHIIKRTK